MLNKGTTGTIFITFLVWRGPWLGIEPGTSRTRSQHSTTRLSRRRYNCPVVIPLYSKPQWEPFPFGPSLNVYTLKNLEFDISLSSSLYIDNIELCHLDYLIWNSTPYNLSCGVPLKKIPRTDVSRYDLPM